MGRRGILVDDDARWVFNRLASDYAARPGYPASLVARLLALAGGRGGRIADLGAGTGHLAIPLAAAGARVTAVEPARAMLRALERAARGAVAAVHASAEATTLPAASQDLAVIADALHWVDPDAAGRELARVVAPGGAIAIVEVRLADTPFLRDLGELVAGVNARARGAAPTAAQGRLRQLLSAAGTGAPSAEHLEDATPLSPARLDAVLRSLSYLGPALGPDALRSLLTRAHALARAHGDPVWTRELTLTWARIRA
jgi:ubiquinone/menaquinone biosynthesis C-methylase UbiE